MFAPECHLDSVPVTCPLVKGLARLEGGAVQVQTDCTLGMAAIFHTMQAKGIIYVSNLVFLQDSL